MILGLEEAVTKKYGRKNNMLQHVISVVFLFVILIGKSVVLSWFGDLKCVLASRDFCQVIPRNLVSIVGCAFDMECFINVDFEF